MDSHQPPSLWPQALLSYDWDATRADLREQLEEALAVYWQVHAEQSLRSVREGGLTAGVEEAEAEDSMHSSHMVNARQVSGGRVGGEEVGGTCLSTRCCPIT